MDSSTKQRLVGAVVLVGAIAWIVPVFLDGPDQAPATISETVELPGIAIGKTEKETIQLDPRVVDDPAPATTVNLPAPVASESADSGSSSDPEPSNDPPAAGSAELSANAEDAVEQPKPQPKPKPKPTPAAPEAQEKPDEAPKAVSEDGLFAVQLGSFSSRENAGKLAASLRSNGVAAFLAELKTDAGAMHRVRVGPVESREAAEKLAAQLAKAGHTGQVVAHP